MEQSTAPIDAPIVQRSLASIVTVKRILPIMGADRIVLAQVNGWQCVIQKDEFAEGDLAIYYCIDSIPDFSDPNTAGIRARGNRIKTIMLRGVLSQGLLAPLSWLTARGHDISVLKEGDDVTERLGVTKYVSEEEADQYLTGDMVKDAEKSDYPSFIPKTDENRLQNMPQFLDYIAGREIVITRKEDGSSGTFIYKDGEFSVCGRNFIWRNPSNSAKNYFLVANKFHIQENMTRLGRNIAVQGEVIGPKINSNRMKMIQYSFRVFNIWDIDASAYLLWDEVVSICNDLGLEIVPVIFRGNASDLELTVPAFINLAEAQTYADGVMAEGIVVKTNDNDLRGSFKVISNKYLLKYKL